MTTKLVSTDVQHPEARDQVQAAPLALQRDTKDVHGWPAWRCMCVPTAWSRMRRVCLDSDQTQQGGHQGLGCCIGTALSINKYTRVARLWPSNGCNKGVREGLAGIEPSQNSFSNVEKLVQEPAVRAISSEVQVACARMKPSLSTARSASGVRHLRILLTCRLSLSPIGPTRKVCA